MTQKDSKIVALMIGRGGSSLKDKNILPVKGYPLLQWAAGAAIRSKYIGRYYISSDDEKILSTAAEMGYTRIKRPLSLATDTAQSCDAVRHAFRIIREQGDANIIVVQHANVGTISESIIDSCIDSILSDGQLSAVVPSHQYNEYHPLRAKAMDSNGLLRLFVQSDQPVSANRQSLPKCFFLDHSIWVLRSSAVLSTNGQPPWDCMGNCIKPFETQGCLDVHSMDDIRKTEQWIESHSVPPPCPTL